MTMLEEMRKEVKRLRLEEAFAWEKCVNAQSLLRMVIDTTHSDYDFMSALAEVVNAHMEYKDVHKAYDTVGDEYFKMLEAL